MIQNISTHPTYSIILAAGAGTRLRPLTRAWFGTDLPKQFCPLISGQSLLGATLERALQISLPERILVVAASEYEAVARAELDRHAPRAELVLQPRNVGTGPGILLPLSRVVAADPAAPLVILPSDHYVRDTARFIATLERALVRAERARSTVLLGAVADRADHEYGWIVSEPTAPGEAARVRRFIEKPSPSEARRLFGSGALWNTFVMAGRAGRFWELGRRHLPYQTERLGTYAELGMQAGGSRLDELYLDLPFGDFSKDVLQQAEGLEVLPLPPCGWSDWGTPERVLADLRQRPEPRGASRLGSGARHSMEIVSDSAAQ